MHNYKKLFDATTAFWIYGSAEITKDEVKKKLMNGILYATNEPNQILVDMVRSLQKLEEMTEEDFIANNKMYPFHKVIEEEMYLYYEFIELSRKDFWKNGYQNFENKENCKCEC